MQKFFRKHMNKILTVSMALLLMVWLGGSALQDMLAPKPGLELIATSLDGEIRQRDLAGMQSVTEILGRMGIPWEAPMPLPGLKPLSVYDWVLLSREARRLGFVPDLNEAEEILNRSRWPRERVNAIANQLEIAPRHVYAAVGEFYNVLDVAQVIAEAALISEAEMRVAARDANEKISINLVALKADDFAKTDGTFSDEEVRAFFDKYREQEAGAGMTFGYFQKPRVKADFVKVDLEKVEQSLRLSPKSLERKARSFWKENRQDRAFFRPRPLPPPVKLPTPAPPTPAPDGDEGDNDGNDGNQNADGPGQGGFTLAQGVVQSGDSDAGQADQTGEEQPGDAAKDPVQATPNESDSSPIASPPPTTLDTIGQQGQATSLPATPPPPPKPPSPYFETWSEAREAAKGVIRKQEAAKRAEKLLTYLIQRGLEPWFDMELGEDNYKKRPAGVDSADYLTELTGNLPPEFQWPGAVTTGVTDWFSEKDAARVPELGSTWLAIPGGSNIAFGNVAFLVQGLAPLSDEADVDRSLYRALYQPGSLALRDAAGNLYLYRITATQPAHPPEDIELVRDQVVADMVKQQGYDEAKRLADRLTEAALLSGLEAAVEAAQADTALGVEVTVQKPRPFARRQLRRPGAFDKTLIDTVGFVDETFTEACFELGQADQGKVPVAVVEVPDLGMVAVVEFSKLDSLSRDAYVLARQGLQLRIQNERASRVLGEWLNPELIKSRNRFKEDRDDG